MELERAGIQTAQNVEGFWYDLCDVWQQVARRYPKGERMRAVALFTRENVLEALDNGELEIAYSAACDDDVRGVAEEIFATLKRHGLDVHWDRDTGRPMWVNLHWKKGARGAVDEPTQREVTTTS